METHRLCYRRRSASFMRQRSRCSARRIAASPADRPLLTTFRITLCIKVLMENCGSKISASANFIECVWRQLIAQLPTHRDQRFVVPTCQWLPGFRQPHPRVQRKISTCPFHWYQIESPLAPALIGHRCQRMYIPLSLSPTSPTPPRPTFSTTIDRAPASMELTLAH